MKKGFIFVVFLMTVLYSAIPVYAVFSGGDGSVDNPYLLSSSSDLRALATMISDGDTSYAISFYRLTNNITADGDAYLPIGTKETPFMGHFDGNGYTISDVVLGANAQGECAYGVFGYAENAVIEDVRLENISLSHDFENTYSTVFVGALCGKLMHTDDEKPCGVNNCAVQSYALSVFGNKAVVFMGGLIGQISDSTSNGGVFVRDVSTSGTANAETPYFAYVGGLIGQLKMESTASFADVEKCITEGTVKASGVPSSAYVGGVIGYAWKDAEDDAPENKTDIHAVFADCTLENNAKTAYLGSICGYAFDTVEEDCYTANAPISSSEKYSIGGTYSPRKDCTSLLALDTASIWYETTTNPKLFMRGDVISACDGDTVCLSGRVISQEIFTVTAFYDENHRLIDTLFLTADDTGRFTCSKKIQSPARFAIFTFQNITTLAPTEKSMSGIVMVKKG